MNELFSRIFSAWKHRSDNWSSARKAQIYHGQLPDGWCMLINLILERQCNRRSLQTNCMLIRPGLIVRFEIWDAIWIKSMESRLDVPGASRVSSQRKLKTDETTTPRVIIINRCMGSTITAQIKPEDAYLTLDRRLTEAVNFPWGSMQHSNASGAQCESHHRFRRRCHRTTSLIKSLLLLERD